MGLVDRLNDDLKTAMKARESDRVSLLRMLMADIKNTGIEKKKRDGLDESEVESVLQKAAKRRQEAAQQFDEGNRPELAEKERAELAIIETYLPEQLDEDAVRAIVASAIEEANATSTKDLGAVMKTAMPKLKGQADGNLVRKLATEILKGD